MPNRVVVTGLGPITPIGVGEAAFWEALIAGRNGIRNVEDVVDLAGIDVKIGGPVDAFDPLDYIEAKKARRLDRSAQFALAATKLALQDAAIDLLSCDLERFGVVAGTGIGGMETFADNLTTLLEKGPRRVSPFFVPRMMPNAISGEISIAHGLKGSNFGVVSACASGTHAIGLATRLIQSGDLDCAIAGGAEAVLLPITYAGFARMGAISRRNDDPQGASRPFDTNRDGFVMGEGAGMLVLNPTSMLLNEGRQSMLPSMASVCRQTPYTSHLRWKAELGQLKPWPWPFDLQGWHLTVLTTSTPTAHPHSSTIAWKPTPSNLR